MEEGECSFSNDLSGLPRGLFRRGGGKKEKKKKEGLRFVSPSGETERQITPLSAV